MVLAQLERVRAYLADRQWDEAVNTLQKVMETSEGKLLEVTPHRWVNLGDYCQLQLAKLPPEALKLYRGRIDPMARKWYKEGVASRDRKLLCNVVEQAFASRWGDKALLALGEMALEAGDYDAARWHWERIIPTQPQPSLPDTWPGYPDTNLDLAMVRRDWCWSRSWKGPRPEHGRNWRRWSACTLGRGDGWAAGRSIMPRPWAS